METDRLLLDAFFTSHPDDAALILERHPPEEAALVLEKSPFDLAAILLERMSPPNGAACLSRLSPKAARAIVAEIPPDSAANLLRRMETEDREALLSSMPQELSAPLELLLRYPEGTAGSLMDPKILSLPDDITVGEALTRVRHSPQYTLYYLYVVDRSQRLVGVVNLRELMLAAPESLLSSVMRQPVTSVSSREIRAAILSHPGWREYHAIPVVDDAGVFVGAIRYETLRRLEDTSRVGGQEKGPLGAFLALGEFYWIGLSGMLSGIVSAVASPTPPAQPARKDENDG